MEKYRPSDKNGKIYSIKIYLVNHIIILWLLNDDARYSHDYF